MLPSNFHSGKGYKGFEFDFRTRLFAQKLLQLLSASGTSSKAFILLHFKYFIAVCLANQTAILILVTASLEDSRKQ